MTTTQDSIAQEAINHDFEDLELASSDMITVKSTDGEHVIRLCKKIMEEHSAAKVDGIIIDAWTATAVWKVYEALNDTNKEKMRNLRTVYRICTVAQKVAFR